MFPIIMYNKIMNKYNKLTDSEIEYYQKKIKLPNIDYPHYQPLKKNNIIVYKHLDINPIDDKEKFEKSDYLRFFNKKELFISNYGRVKFDNEIIEPFIVGPFLHCLKVKIKNINYTFYVHRMVMETFKPIEEKENLDVHHINNNALNNCIDNLLWVSKTDHYRIHKKSIQDLRKTGNIIRINNKNELLKIFQNNQFKEISGKELVKMFNNKVFYDVIRDNIYALVKEDVISDITEGNNIKLKNKIFKLKI